MITKDQYMQRRNRPVGGGYGALVAPNALAPNAAPTSPLPSPGNPVASPRPLPQRTAPMQMFTAGSGGMATGGYAGMFGNIPQAPAPTMNMTGGGFEGNLPQPRDPSKGLTGNLPVAAPGMAMGSPAPVQRPTGALAGGMRTSGSGRDPTQVTDREVYDLWKQDNDSANAANESRYAQILDLNATGGAAQLADLNSSYAGLSGMAQQQGQGQQDFLRGAFGEQGNLLGSIRGEELGFQQGQKGRMDSILDGFSDVERDRNERRTRDELGALRQYAGSSGLARTSVPREGVRDIYDRNAQRDADISDRELNRRLGVEDAYTSRYGGLMSDLDRQRMNLAGGETASRYGALAGNDQTLLNLAGGYGDARAGLSDRLRQDREGIIERRTDEGPSLEMLLQFLAQARGQGAGGGGGGYAGLMGGGRSGGGGNYASSGGRSPFSNGFNPDTPALRSGLNAKLRPELSASGPVKNADYYRRQRDELFNV